MKRNFRKVLSVLSSVCIAFAMLGGLSAAVNAAATDYVTNIDGWSIVENNSPSQYYVKREKPDFGLSEYRKTELADSYGDYCLHMYKGSTGGTVRLTQSITGLDPNQNYRIQIAYYVHRDSNSQAHNTNISVESRDRNNLGSLGWFGSNEPIATLEAGETKGWIDWSTVRKPKADGTMNFIFAITGDNEGIYLDAIYVVPANGNNYIEDYSQGNLVKNAGFTVSSLIANVANGEARISWRNPNYSSISAVDIVDENGISITAGATLESPNGASLSTAAGAWNYVRKTGLTNGTTYNYKLKLTTSYGTDEYPFTVVAKNIANVPITTTDGFDLEGTGSIRDNSSQNTILNYGGLYIDKTEKYSGSSSLKITQNKDGVFTIIRLISHNGDQNKKYRMTFKAKIKRTTNATGYFRATNEEGWSPITLLYQNEKKTTGWQEYTLDMTNTNKQKKPVFQLDGAVDAVWIDDLTIYELDSNNAPTGPNLTPYGDFETGGVSDVVIADNENGTATATYNINNYINNKEFNAILITAAYEGELLLKCDYKILSQVGVSSNPITEQLTINYAGADKVRAFVWKDWETIQPLFRAETISVNN